MLGREEGKEFLAFVANCAVTQYVLEKFSQPVGSYFHFLFFLWRGGGGTATVGVKSTANNNGEDKKTFVLIFFYMDCSHLLSKSTTSFGEDAESDAPVSSTSCHGYCLLFRGK